MMLINSAAAPEMDYGSRMVSGMAARRLHYA